MDSLRRKKKVNDSKMEQSYIVMPKHTNQYGHLFGGQLVAWMDELAGLVALRHSEHMVVTASMDKLEFKSGAKLKDIVVLCAFITHVGNSSMEIKVETFVQELSGTKRMINQAYVVMVAIDENFTPVEVPDLILDTEAERDNYEAGRKRYQLRMIDKSD